LFLHWTSFSSLLEFNEVNSYSAIKHEEQCSPFHSAATQPSSLDQITFYETFTLILSVKILIYFG